MKIETVILVVIFMFVLGECSKMAQAGESCPKTVMVNHTDTWTDYDQATYDRAIKRCGELYKDTPCLKRFIKKDQLTYNAICGR